MPAGPVQAMPPAQPAPPAESKPVRAARAGGGGGRGEAGGGGVGGKWASLRVYRSLASYSSFPRSVLSRTYSCPQEYFPGLGIPLGCSWSCCPDRTFSGFTYWRQPAGVGSDLTDNLGWFGVANTIRRKTVSPKKTRWLSCTEVSEATQHCG